MPPHLEEAFRALRLADRDIEAFLVLREAPRVHSSITGFHAHSLRRLNPFAVMMRYDDLEGEAVFLNETAVWLQTIRDWAGKQVEIIVRQAS